MSGTHEFGGTRIEAGRPSYLVAVIADLLLHTHDGRRCANPVLGVPVAPHEGALPRFAIATAPSILPSAFIRRHVLYEQSETTRPVEQTRFGRLEESLLAWCMLVFRTTDGGSPIFATQALRGVQRRCQLLVGCTNPLSSECRKAALAARLRISICFLTHLARPLRSPSSTDDPRHASNPRGRR